MSSEQIESKAYRDTRVAGGLLKSDAGKYLAGTFETIIKTTHESSKMIAILKNPFLADIMGSSCEWHLHWKECDLSEISGGQAEQARKLFAWQGTHRSLR